jgi:ferredoxin/fatty-acid desaturase
MASQIQGTSAWINGQRIEVAPGETLLLAALREGIDFPNRCRVGGCGTCRCRLAEGQVHERTETAYLLSEDEIKRGFILACQSVPSTDVSVEVALGAAAPGRARAKAAEAAREPASLLDYAKYFGFHAVGLSSAVALMAGGGWITAGLLAIVMFYILGDAVSGNDTRTPKFARPGVLTAQLWLALPLVTLIVFCSVWGVSAGDPLGWGALVTQWAGYDVVAARDATTFGHHVSAIILTGLMIGMIGTITAHELMHRTWDKGALSISRWLMAFSFDTAFTIEHVYGHHRYVATPQDPATAPRGRNVYSHILRSTLAGNASAWRIECKRLRTKQLSIWSPHNVVLRGYAMSAVLLALAWAVGGVAGALFFAACGLAGKALLEVVNYMEHYGIVRDPARPVQPRHSWNTNRRISSWTLFNLTRHSHHHAQGEVPFQDLRPMAEAPMMIGGYLTVMVVALVPPLWHHLMTPKLLAWDRDFADAGEWHLARAANAASGIALLERAARDAGGSDMGPSGAPWSALPQSSRGQSEASSVSR